MPDGSNLEAEYAVPEPKVAKRLERLKDMVMYRFGGTGAWQAVQTAVELKNPAVAYPVRSLTSFATDSAGSGGAFADAYMVKEGTTVRQLANMISPHLAGKQPGTLAPTLTLTLTLALALALALT